MEKKRKDDVPTPMHTQYQPNGMDQSYQVRCQSRGSHVSGQPAPSIPSADLPHTTEPLAADPGSRTQAAHQQHQLHQIQAAHTHQIQQAAQLQGQQHQQQFQCLKVDDALSYLNQVKLRFGKPSRVYNEFIEILKEFKYQSIDTCDVFSRVSTLFMGHSDLIVGFNQNFLPTRYKIEVQANDIIAHRPGQPVMSLTTAMTDNAAAATNAANAASAGQYSFLPSRKPSSQYTGFSRSAISISTGSSDSGTHHSYQQRELPQMQAAHTQQAAQLQGQQQQQQFQRVNIEDALSYLDQVKLRFRNKPGVYNEFLDIMKEYQYRNIGTSDVISRVLTLFMGHSDLLVGFTTFLRGYKIGLRANAMIDHQPGQPVMSLTTAMVATAAAATNAANAANAGQDSFLPSRKPSSQAIGFSRSAISVSTGGSDSGTHHSYHQQPPRCGQDSLASPPLSKTPQAQQGSLEMRFVNKVKNRFQDQPHVFKSFLDILNTYQKQQNNMKEGIRQPTYGGGKALSFTEVYSQVTNLLKDQEDLLSEFGQFAPDANGSASSGTDSD